MTTPAHGASADPVEVPGHGAAGQGPAGRLVGGQRRRRAGRRPVRRQHRRDRLRAPPAGSRLWTFTAGNSIWTTPAFAADGSSYWGSLDLNIYHLEPSGRPLWHTFTPGYVISSPAIGSDGTVYVGSFDSKLYALDPGDRDAALDVRDHRSHLRLARARPGPRRAHGRDLHRLDRRLGVRAVPGRPAALAL